MLGFTALVSPAGIDVAHAALVFDMQVMIAAALACLPIFFSGYLNLLLLMIAGVMGSIYFLLKSGTPHHILVRCNFGIH